VLRARDGCPSTVFPAIGYTVFSAGRTRPQCTWFTPQRPQKWHFARGQLIFRERYDAVQRGKGRAKKASEEAC